MKVTTTLLRWLAVAWTIIMLIGCLMPHSQLPDELLTWSDKGQHILIFALFSLLWVLAGVRLGTVAAAGFLFGGLIELLQYVLPINRSGDWLDLAADCVGIIVGIVLTFGIRFVVHIDTSHR